MEIRRKGTTKKRNMQIFEYFFYTYKEKLAIFLVYVKK